MTCQGRFKYSNFKSSPITDLMGNVYPTIEHYYQAFKTTGKERQKIRKAETPADAKRMGRTVKLRPDWEYVK